jgi:hypothetical protein
MPDNERNDDRGYDFEELLNELAKGNNYEEIRTMCATLTVSFDDLPGEGLRARIRELILFMERRGRVAELAEFAPYALRKHTAPPSKEFNVPKRVTRTDSRAAAVRAGGRPTQPTESVSYPIGSRTGLGARASVAVYMIVILTLLSLIAYLVLAGYREMPETQKFVDAVIVALFAGLVAGFFTGSFRLTKPILAIPFAPQIKLSANGGFAAFIVVLGLWFWVYLPKPQIRLGTPPVKPNYRIDLRPITSRSFHSPLYWLSFNSTGDVIAAAGAPRRLLQWAYESSVPPIDLDAGPASENRSIRSVAFHPSGDQIFAGDTEGTLWVWKDSARPVRYTIYSGAIYGIYVSSTDADEIVVTGRDKGKAASVRRYKFEKQPILVDELVLDHPADLILGVSSDFRVVATSNFEKKNIQLRSLNTRQLIVVLDSSGIATESGGTFTSDGSYFAVGDKAGNIRVWTTNDGKLIGTLRLSSDSISSVALTKIDGELVAAAGNVNGEMAVWYGKNFFETMILDGFNEPVYCVVFSPDSSRLAASSRTGIVRLWRLQVANSEDADPT